MAGFNADYLSQVPGIGVGKVQLWTYKTEDAAATVDTAGYFPVGYGIKNGDWVFRTTVTNLGKSNEALSEAGFHIVNAVSATQIDVADETAAEATDTD